MLPSIVRAAAQLYEQLGRKDRVSAGQAMLSHVACRVGTLDAAIRHAQAAWAAAPDATGGQAVDMVLLPKFLGILPFDQANRGAEEAHAELGNAGELLYTGPTPENSAIE